MFKRCQIVWRGHHANIVSICFSFILLGVLTPIGDDAGDDRRRSESTFKMICLEIEHEFRQVFQIHASSPFKILKETGVPAVIVSTKEESRKKLGVK